jgi:hypothetical protein
MPIQDNGFNEKLKHAECMGQLNILSEKLAVIDGPLFAYSWITT